MYVHTVLYAVDSGPLSAVSEQCTLHTLLEVLSTEQSKAVQCSASSTVGILSTGI